MIRPEPATFTPATPYHTCCVPSRAAVLCAPSPSAPWWLIAIFIPCLVVGLTIQALWNLRNA